MKARLGISLALLFLVAGSANASVSNDQVQSQHIREADGTSGQNTNSGSGVKTGHIQDGAVTDAKISGPISASKISSTGLNADTVDGVHASGFAPATHSHAQEDVTGLVSSLASKSDTTHDHDALYQKKYGKVAVVAQAGGDYTSPVSAINDLAQWCGTPSSDNPCLLKVMPGVYDLGSQTFAMREYVDVEGSGQYTTVIVSSAANDAVVHGASNSELRFLTVEHTGLAGTGVLNNATSLRLSHITISVSGSRPCWGIRNVASTSVITDVDVVVNVSGGAGYSYGIQNVGNSSTKMNNVNVTVTGASASGYEELYGIRNDGSSSVMSNVTVAVSGSDELCCAFANFFYCTAVVMNSTFSSSGTAYSLGAYNLDSSVSLSDVTVVGSGGTTNYGMWNQDPCDIQVDRSSIEGTTSSIYNLYNTTPVKIGSSKLVGPFVGGTGICVSSYNGSYAPLGATCQ